MAEQRGIRVVSNDFFDVSGEYNFITAFDVLEHMEGPAQFLRDALGHLSSKGYMVLSTGNLDAFTFKLLGGRYWYSAIAEHVSFLNLRWVAEQAEGLQMSLVEEARFSHSDPMLRRAMREIFTNVLYVIAPPSFGKPESGD